MPAAGFEARTSDFRPSFRPSRIRFVYDIRTITKILYKSFSQSQYLFISDSVAQRLRRWTSARTRTIQYRKIIGRKSDNKIVRKSDKNRMKVEADQSEKWNKKS